MNLAGPGAFWLALPGGKFAPVERPAGKALLAWPGKILKGPVLGVFSFFLEFAPNAQNPVAPRLSSDCQHSDSPRKEGDF